MRNGSLCLLFAAFDAAATVQTVRDLLKVYAWIAKETAVHLHYPYPIESLELVHRWIEKTLRETD